MPVASETSVSRSRKSPISPLVLRWEIASPVIRCSSSMVSMMPCPTASLIWPTGIWLSKPEKVIGAYSDI